MDAEGRYKRDIAGLYDRAASTYGQIGPPFFAHAGRRLVELADVGQHQRVLDVACGRGAVLLPAADRAEFVLGVDLSEEMLRRTAAGNPGVHLCLMDAEHLALADDSFDVLLNSFALFFFLDLDGALAGFRRVLRPGGTVGIAFSEDLDPRWQWMNELMTRHAAFPESPPGAARGREHRRPGALVDLLTAAGFVDARELREDAVFDVASPDEWWDSLWTHGSRRAMEAMTLDALEAFRAESYARLSSMQAEPEGLTQRYRFIYALARRDVSS